MSVTALVDVWGAPSVSAVAHQIASLASGTPQFHRYCGGDAGEWHLAQHGGGAVTVRENRQREGDEAPVWLSVYWPGPLDRVYALTARLFDHLEATTDWGLELDVDGHPTRRRNRTADGAIDDLVIAP